VSDSFKFFSIKNKWERTMKKIILIISLTLLLTTFVIAKNNLLYMNNINQMKTNDNGNFVKFFDIKPTYNIYQIISPDNDYSYSITADNTKLIITDNGGGYGSNINLYTNTNIRISKLTYIYISNIIDFSPDYWHRCGFGFEIEDKNHNKYIIIYTTSNTIWFETDNKNKFIKRIITKEKTSYIINPIKDLNENNVNINNATITKIFRGLLVWSGTISQIIDKIEIGGYTSIIQVV